jgi:hypothetical protein
VGADHLGVHPGIATDPGGSAETLGLAVADCFDPFADTGGGLGLLLAGYFTELTGGHLEVDVDPAEPWAGDAVAIALDLDEAAAALAFRVAEEAALAWMRCHFANQRIE